MILRQNLIEPMWHYLEHDLNWSNLFELPKTRRKIIIETPLFYKMYAKFQDYKDGIVQGTCRLTNKGFVFSKDNGKLKKHLIWNP
jgi:hypothetical protein